MAVRLRDGRVGRTAGRFSLHSAMASFKRGASVRPPGGALAGARRAAGQGPDLVFALASQARQVLRAPAENTWASGAQQAFSCHLLGCMPFQETQPALARPTNHMPLSLRRVPACWGRDPALGTKQVLWARGLFHSSVPTSLSTSMGLWVPGPGAGLAGGGRREQPLRGRGC